MQINIIYMQIKISTYTSDKRKDMGDVARIWLVSYTDVYSYYVMPWIRLGKRKACHTTRICNTELADKDACHPNCPGFDGDLMRSVFLKHVGEWSSRTTSTWEI